MEDAFEEIFSSLLLFVGLEYNVELLEHFPDSVELAFHAVSAKHNDWLHDELDEASWKLFSILSVAICHEFLFSWTEEIITPELLHQFCAIKLKL